MVVVAGLLAVVIGLGIAAFNSDKPSAAEIAQAQATYDVERREVRATGRPLRRPERRTLHRCPDATASTTGRPPRSTASCSVTSTRSCQRIATFVILLGCRARRLARRRRLDQQHDADPPHLGAAPHPRLSSLRGLVIAVSVFAITALLQLVVRRRRSCSSRRPVAPPASCPRTSGDRSRSRSARTSVVASAFGLIAYAIAMIGRSTVAALGALVGYLILFEAVIAGFRPSIQGDLLVRSAGVDHHAPADHQPTPGRGPGAVLLGGPARLVRGGGAAPVVVGRRSALARLPPARRHLSRSRARDYTSDPSGSVRALHVPAAEDGNDDPVRSHR